MLAERAEGLRTSSRHLQDDLKTSSKSLQDVLQRCLEDIFKTFSRRFIKLKFLLTRLEDIFKTSSRHIQHVFEKYCEDDYLQKDMPMSHF